MAGFIAYILISHCLLVLSTNRERDSRKDRGRAGENLAGIARPMTSPDSDPCQHQRSLAVRTHDDGSHFWCYTKRISGSGTVTTQSRTRLGPQDPEMIVLVQLMENAKYVHSWDLKQYPGQDTREAGIVTFFLLGDLAGGH